MAITKEQKQQLISEFGASPKDTGNIAVQIAILTHEISNLTEHLKISKKDLHSKSGIYKKAAKRHSLLVYLKKEDPKTHQELIKKLKIREQK